jgi:hypothetical protein
MSLAPDHHMIRHSWRVDPISCSTKPFCQGDSGAGSCSGFPWSAVGVGRRTIDAIPVPELLKAFVRQLQRSMIAFGGIDVVLHVAARGRTGGPEKFHSSTAKDFFCQTSALRQNRQRWSQKLLFAEPRSIPANPAPCSKAGKNRHRESVKI